DSEPTATAPTSAGSYTITVSLAEGDAYDAIADLALGAYTIAKATVSVDWSNIALTYTGSAQAPTATATGVLQEDLPLTVSGQQTNAGDSYEATASLATPNANYALEVASTVKVFSIAAATVSVQWGDAAFTYTGSAQAPTATATGVLQEDLPLTVSGQQTNAGDSYEAIASLATPNANYALEAASAVKLFSITPATLTVTPHEQSKTYGAADPAFTYDVDNLQNGEQASAVLSGELSRVPGDTVGSYSIEQGGLSANSSYSISFTSGKQLTILKAAPSSSHLAFKLPDTATYDGQKHRVEVALKSNYTGMGAIAVLYNGDTAPPSSAGTYAIAVSIRSGTNFSDASDLALGAFTIKKAAPSTSHLNFLLPDTATYNGSEHPVEVALKSDYSGMGKITVLYYADNETLLPSAPVNAGAYAVKVGIPDSGNFSRDTVALDAFTIGKATLTKGYLLFTQDSSVIYDGLAHGVPTPQLKSPYTGIGPVTVLYNGSEAQPDSAGAYAISIKTTAGANFHSVSDLSLGATFAINYLVRFDANGGSPVPPQQVALAGDTVARPGDPGKQGYFFGGWCSDAGLTRPWSFSTDKVTGNTTLYARWSTSEYELWGVVMRKEEEAAERFAPYAGAIVVYTVGSAPADTVRTDASGRYRVSELELGDTVTLRLQEVERGWMATPLQQTCTISSAGLQADTIFYEPDTDTVSLLWLALIVNGNEQLASWSRKEIDSITYYQIGCNLNSSTLSIRYATPAGVTASVSMETETGAVEPLSSAENQIAVDMENPGRKVYYIDLSSKKRYVVVLYRRYGLFDIITEHLGNLRVVNNNPQTNGGLQIASCRWYMKQAAAEGDAAEWQLVGNKLYYSIGPSATDKFTSQDSMYVVLQTEQGEQITTCVDVKVTSKNNENGGSGGSGGSSSSSKEDRDNSAYPNPVQGGGKIYLKESVIIGSDDDDGGGSEEHYATYRLFTSQGKLVLSGSAYVLIEGLVMPETAGTYYLVLDGNAGRKTMQIAVGQRKK
ncbi:MAG: InlB B-repeat-containing protein, partial [Prevotellaceae bacterium]|nr:InlB B-repeat-containing protein [Prevotellaceae bacterium]